jgi:hypothetical protein
VARNCPSRPVERADTQSSPRRDREVARVCCVCGTIQRTISKRASSGAEPLRFTQPNLQLETRMVVSLVGRGCGLRQMEQISKARLQCLLVSSKDPAHLKTVVSMLQERGIQTEEGLHRPWRSANFEPSIMVSPEDHQKASVLYKELELPPGTGPTLVPSSAPSRPMESGKRRFLPEFFARPKRPEPTDSGRLWDSRASG